MKNKSLNLLYLFWFLKFIVDLFYQEKAFTIVITVFALLLFVLNIRNNRMKFNFSDLAILILIILFSFSFYKSPSYFIDYLKVLSAFILYFLGRMLYLNIDKTNKVITVSLFIVFIINLFVIITGKGTITWGNASTLKGLYFFKTDFASMLTTFLVFWLWNYERKKIIKYIVTCLVLLLILLTNARIYYLIVSLIILMYIFYKRNIKIYSFKTVIVVFISIILIILGIQFITNLSIFDNRNMIGLEFNSLSDLFNSSNTQGRNEIWTVLLNNFNKQSSLTRIFGAGLSFYVDFGYKGFNEHSTYIKVLLNTGYIGITLFSILIYKIVKSISKIKNTKYQFIATSLLIIFLISGFSSPTLFYINTSWLPLFYSGVSISYSQLSNQEVLANQKEEYNYEKT